MKCVTFVSVRYHICLSRVRYICHCRPLCNSLDFWALATSSQGETARCFSPSFITLSPASRQKERSVWERVSEGVTIRTLSYTLMLAQVLALPVWARWEWQIIQTDKMRNAAQHSGGDVAYRGLFPPPPHMSSNPRNTNNGLLLSFCLPPCAVSR